MRHPAFLVAVACLLAPLAAHAGDVVGTVHDARGQAAAGVELTLGDARTVTGADGSYRFADVPAGDHMLAAGPQRVTVSVAEAGETRRNIVLLSRSARLALTEESAVQLPDKQALVESMDLADAMFAEAEAIPPQRWVDFGG